jgi:hypothetical protein
MPWHGLDQSIEQYVGTGYPAWPDVDPGPVVKGRSLHR